MHVSLTDKLDEYIKKQIESGLYNNASEVVREALRLKIQADQTEQAKLEALRRDIGEAIEQADRGAFVPFDPDAIAAELDKELESEQRD